MAVSMRRTTPCHSEMFEMSTHAEMGISFVARFQVIRFGITGWHWIHITTYDDRYDLIGTRKCKERGMAVGARQWWRAGGSGRARARTATSHSRTLLSHAPETICLPFGEKATEFTSPVWPVSSACCSPVCKGGEMGRADGW
jgi:hypothetical protein